MKKRVYAVKLTAENMDDIITYGARHHLNLNDFRDDLEYNAEDGYDTYVIVTMLHGNDDQAITFVTQASIDFDNTWQFETSTYWIFTRVFLKTTAR